MAEWVCQCPPIDSQGENSAARHAKRRRDNAPADFSLLRQRALNLPRQEKTCKNGLTVERSKAGGNNACLLRVFASYS